MSILRVMGFWCAPPASWAQVPAASPRYVCRCCQLRAIQSMADLPISNGRNPPADGSAWRPVCSCFFLPVAPRACKVESPARASLS
ncbi:hypothetical protein IWZ03DRAFT_367357 [Phyllosticta citriasiana]|uniref:Secreted protein n=1 Tax=Phyllosticta citriasiana TaxID=595635 RepID=A0ABR1L094_9PEZI